MTALPSYLAGPEMRSVKAFSVEGLAQRFALGEAAAGAPALWGRFLARRSEIATSEPGVTYGVCYNGDDAGFDYLAGAPVASLHPAGDGFTHLRLPTHVYATFRMNAPIRKIAMAWDAVWKGWLPDSGYVFADTPILERYGPDFDPEAGGVDLMLPVRRR